MPRTHSSSITNEVVGEEIRGARLRQGLTQRELAERLGAAPAYVSAVEAGRENLTLGSLARIADALRSGLQVTFPPVEAEYETLDEEIAELERESRMR